MSAEVQDQLSLLEWRPPVASPGASEQSMQLARVESEIGESVLDWCRERLAAGTPRFHGADLAEHVKRSFGGGSPDSASRILRRLRGGGHVAYRVIKRSESLYELDRVGSATGFR